MSTNQPPYVISSDSLQSSKGLLHQSSGVLQPMATNQPPRPQSQQQLLALSTGAALAGLDFWRLRFQLDEGAIPALQVVRHNPANITGQQDSDFAQLVAQSSDVMLMLAVAEFWATTRVEGSEWSSTGGIPPCTTSLEPPSGRSGLPAWQLTLPAISANVYEGSVAKVAGQIDPKRLPAALAQADAPQLWMALAMGMLDRADNLKQTCLVIDAVQAVVTVAVQRLKQKVRVPRPDHCKSFPMSKAIPLIRVPGFTAYPGGHAALMHALAVVLCHVTGYSPSSQPGLDAIAADVARNREAMGLHTDIDTATGTALGRAMGQWMVEAIHHPDYRPWGAICGAAAKEWL
jgi:hypothetical protein